MVTTYLSMYEFSAQNSGSGINLGFGPDSSNVPIDGGPADTTVTGSPSGSVPVNSTGIGVSSSVSLGTSLAFGGALLHLTVMVTVASFDTKLSLVSLMVYLYVS